MPYSQDPHPKVGSSQTGEESQLQRLPSRSKESEPSLGLKSLGLGGPASGT